MKVKLLKKIRERFEVYYTDSVEPNKGIYVMFDKKEKTTTSRTGSEYALMYMAAQVLSVELFRTLYNSKEVSKLNITHKRIL